MRTVFPLAVCLLVGACCLCAEENDWLIVPGKRVGPITASAVRADIVRIFGAKNVREDEILTSDMGSETGTQIYGDQPEISLAVFWISDSPDSRIRRIRFCPTLELPGKCRWHTADGITVGINLKELERLNGRAFQVHGFDWGFGGLVTSWEKGRLEKLAGGCGGLSVRLDPPPGPASVDRARLMDELEGDDDFTSSSAALQALNPIVDFLNFSFQGCPVRPR